MDAPWITLIAVFIGSSGVAGLITLAIQHSRAARLRRSIRESLALAAQFEPDERPAHALRAAARIDAYRLAAMSLMPVPWRLVRLVILIAMGTVVAVSVLVAILAILWPPLITSEFPYWWWQLTIAGGTVTGMVLGLEFVMRERRDAVVGRLLRPGTFTVKYKRGFAYMTGARRDPDRPPAEPPPLAAESSGRTAES